jgi:hypothetical protein
MVMKHYPPEFKAEAVALYRSRPGHNGRRGRPGSRGQRRDAAIVDPAR